MIMGNARIAVEFSGIFCRTYLRTAGFSILFAEPSTIFHRFNDFGMESLSGDAHGYGQVNISYRNRINAGSGDDFFHIGNAVQSFNNDADSRFPIGLFIAVDLVRTISVAPDIGTGTSDPFRGIIWRTPQPSGLLPQCGYQEPLLPRLPYPKLFESWFH